MDGDSRPGAKKKKILNTGKYECNMIYVYHYQVPRFSHPALYIKVIREWLSDWNSFANETRIFKENRVHIHG